MTPHSVGPGSFIHLGTYCFRPADAPLWCKRVPEADRVVTGTRHQPRAVGAEGDGVDVVLVAAQLGHLLARGDVPQADRVIPAGGGQPGAVGAEGQAVNTAPVGKDGKLRLR